MRVKDSTVECKFHPMLTSLLFTLDTLYRDWATELIVTSGSETGTRHGYTSLHYATPAQAADIRTLQTGSMPAPAAQVVHVRRETSRFCAANNIPNNWVDIVLESNHIHIEYQPKRLKESN